jgi:hypothetical protein
MTKMLVHLTRMTSICVEVEADTAASAADTAALHANSEACDNSCHPPTDEGDGEWEVFGIDKLVTVDGEPRFQTIAGMDADEDHGWVLQIAEGE